MVWLVLTYCMRYDLDIFRWIYSAYFCFVCFSVHVLHFPYLTFGWPALMGLCPFWQPGCFFPNKCCCCIGPLAIIAVFVTQKLQQMLEKTVLWRIYLRDSEDFLRSLYAAYLQFVDGDLPSNGRIVQFYHLLYHCYHKVRFSLNALQTRK